MQEDLGSRKPEGSGDSEDDGLGLSEAAIDEIVRRLEARLDGKARRRRDSELGEHLVKSGGLGRGSLSSLLSTSGSSRGVTQ